MMPHNRGPPRRPPSKQPMSSAKQVQLLTQQQTPVARMLQQQTRERRSHVVRSTILFIALALMTSYAYNSYGIIVATTLLIGGWMVGWLELVQIGLSWVVRTAGQPSYDEMLRRADIMSQPITLKDTVTGENDLLEYGSSSMQGWRRTMEDAHTLLLLEKGGFFGVYDGHSGAATARYCGEYMFQFVHQTKAFVKGEISQALYDGFIAIDKYLHSLPSFERGGCAAVVLYLVGDDVYCANAGDSRCVMCRNGSVDALSTDHKPILPSEQMRIERAGCYVQNRRVNGMLALSRAIGDFMFKMNAQVSWEMQAVTCAPEVRVTKLNRDKDEFAVLACDGIWDMMSSKQVVDFVRPRIQKRVPLGTICEELMDACLSPSPFGLGCDNMSVVIVKFKRGPQGTPPMTQGTPAATTHATPLPQPATVASSAASSADGAAESAGEPRSFGGGAAQDSGDTSPIANNDHGGSAASSTLSSVAGTPPPQPARSTQAGGLRRSSSNDVIDSAASSVQREGGANGPAPPTAGLHPKAGAP